MPDPAHPGKTGALAQTGAGAGPGRPRPLDTIEPLGAAGVDVFGSGSGLFNENDGAENIWLLKEHLH